MSIDTYKMSERLVNDMIEVAKTSSITHKLSATLIRGSKRIGNIYCNSDRMCCRGKVFPSMHAEANTILNFFGKSLRYSDNKGWCVLRDKVAKGAKVSSFGYNCNTC
jgi:hypothetical protein